MDKAVRAEREQYQRAMRRANEVMGNMQRDDPEAWREYRSELRSFEDATISDGLTDAASDWPEYNGDGND
jgi:hypothetical protein